MKIHRFLRTPPLERVSPAPVEKEREREPPTLLRSRGDLGKGLGNGENRPVLVGGLEQKYLWKITIFNG